MIYLEGHFQKAPAIETVSPADDINRRINESNLLLNEIALKNIPPKKEELFVIGEVALSRAEKNLDKLSRDNQSSKLIETGGFAKLYSDMSFAFGMKKIPIELSRYGPPEEQISIENNLSSERELISGPIQPEYQDQFEPNRQPRIYLRFQRGFTESLPVELTSYGITKISINDAGVKAQQLIMVIIFASLYRIR